MNNIGLSKANSQIFEDKLKIQNDLYDGLIDRFKENSSYTAQQWMKFVYKKLNKIQGKKETINSRINELVYTTISLNNMLNKYNKKEFYQLTTADIIEFLGQIPLAHCDNIYQFLKVEYQTLHTQLQNNNIKNRGLYNVKNIGKHIQLMRSKTNNLGTADIYSVEEFLECINYSSRLEFHIAKSIEEIKQKGTIQYVSSWLYVLIHLNNGWRNGDVKDFQPPYIDDLIDDYGIDDYEWFHNNFLNIAEARLIISRIINNEIKMSKTRVQGYFFCSDDLAIPIATAIIIIRKYKQLQSEVIQEKDDYFLTFGTKYNTPSQNLLKKYFVDMENKSFKFKSLKMNATLLSYIYSLTLEDSREKVLIFAQKVRAHKMETSTLHYIKIEKRDIEALSRQLFERGEFGYIYDFLRAKIDGQQNRIVFEERTNKIIEIKEKLRTSYNVEIISGFLNKVTREREEVLSKIENMSLREMEQKLHQIYIGSLPSKELHIQCLVSGECPKYGNEANCKSCPYAIPTVYALNLICQNASKNLWRYHKESIVGEKIKLSVKIEKDLDLISEAINKYGAQVVYSFMKIPREEYVHQVTEVVEPPENLYLMSEYLD